MNTQFKLDNALKGSKVSKAAQSIWKDISESVVRQYNLEHLTHQDVFNVVARLGYEHALDGLHVCSSDMTEEDEFQYFMKQIDLTNEIINYTSVRSGIHADCIVEMVEIMSDMYVLSMTDYFFDTFG